MTIKKDTKYYVLLLIVLTFSIGYTTLAITSTRATTASVQQKQVQSIAEIQEQETQQRISEVLAYGTQTTKTGTSEVIIYDFIDGSSQTDYFLEENGNRYKIYFKNKKPKLISGDRLKIEGVYSGNEIVSTWYKIQESALQTTQDQNIGEQRTVVLLVNFANNPGTPITVNEARNRVFNEQNFNAITSYIKEVSYTQTFLSGDVFGWYTLEGNQNCILFTLATSAMNAANNDVDFLQYDRLIIVFPSTSLCTYGGLSSLGMINTDTPDGTKNMSIIGINGPNNLDNGVEFYFLA